MKSLGIKITFSFCAFLVLNSCTQLFGTNEIMVDSLLTEQKVIEVLSEQEWIQYQYFDPYTLTLPGNGSYSSGTNRILHLEAGGRFSERTNTLFPQLKAQGKWRFISAKQSEKVIFQKEERYKKIIQGKLILLDSISNAQKYATINIDTLQMGISVVIVSNREFFMLYPSIHGPVSWYYRAK